MICHNRVMQKILFLLAGGIAGTLSRYFLTLAATRLWGSVLPIGTLLVNGLGCFVAGLLAGLGETRIALSLEQRVMLFTGFCGAFTTFSAMIVESDYLYRSTSFIGPFLNILINLIIGFTLFRAGFFLGK